MKSSNKIIVLDFHLSYFQIDPDLFVSYQVEENFYLRWKISQPLLDDTSACFKYLINHNKWQKSVSNLWCPVTQTTRSTPDDRWRISPAVSDYCLLNLYRNSVKHRAWTTLSLLSLCWLHWWFEVNPLRAKFSRENINIYLHFMSFLHTNKTQVPEIPPRVRQGPAYSTWSISWLLMSWRR